MTEISHDDPADPEGDPLSAGLDVAQNLEAVFTAVLAAVTRAVGTVDLDLPGMDEACRGLLETATLPPLRAEAPAPPSGPAAGVDNLYIVTEIYPAGGHRLMLEQMIRSRPGDRHAVLFTGLHHRTRTFSMTRMKDLGVSASAPDPHAILWDKWLWLRQRVAAHKAQRVFLLHHPEDVLATLVAQEFEPFYGHRLLVLRHADTVASLGADLTGATHLAIRPAQAAALRQARPQMAVRLLPLCVDPDNPPPRLVAETPLTFSRLSGAMPRRRVVVHRGCQALRRSVWTWRRARFAALERMVSKRADIDTVKGPLTTATCGTEHKFTLEGPLALPRVLARVLDATRGRHVHIGPATPRLRAACFHALDSAGIDRRRLRFTGEVPSVYVALRWHRVGLYLGSFPVSGALSRAEAARAGLPIAVQTPPGGDARDAYLAATDFAPETALTWSRLETLIQTLKSGFGPDQRQRMGHAARAWYEQSLSPRRFKEAFDDILSSLDPVPLPDLPLAPQRPRPVASVRRTGEPARVVETRCLRFSPDTGSKCLPVWPEGPFHVSRPRVVAHRHIAQPGQQWDAPAVEAAPWTDAVIVGGADGFIARDGAWIDPGLEDFGANHLQLRHPGAVSALNGSKVTLTRHKTEGTVDSAIFACGCYSHNYYHFLLEVLPRAQAAARLAPPDTPVLTESDLPVQCYQALRLALPHHPIHRVRRGESIAVKLLYDAGMGTIVNDLVPSANPLSAADLRYHPALVRELAGFRAMGRARVGQGPDHAPERGTRRLFLWRRSTGRRVRNEARLRSLLQDRGFEIVDTSTLSFPDQIRLMAGAGTIVAQSGAQLTNIAFAPLGCRVIALFSDAPGINYRLWSAMGEMLGHEVINIAGPHQPGRAGIHADFTIPEEFLLPLIDVDQPFSAPATLSACLSGLSGLSGDADVLTGAWAVVAGATPEGFSARLVGLRRAAVAGVEAASGAALKGHLGHRFFADYGRNLRSGFLAFADLSAEEQTLAARTLAGLRTLAETGRIDGAGGTAEPEQGLNGDPEEDARVDPAAARRLLMLGMLLVENWRVPLPRDPGTLPDDVLERWLHWASLPPFLYRAGDDAGWVAHVARLLNWVADGLDATRDEPGAGQGALRQRLLRLVSGLDLGQLLLVDVPLNDVQAARNRVLAHVALRTGRPRARMRPGVPVSGGTEPVSLRDGANAGAGAAGAPERRRIGILCRTFEKGPDSEAVVAFVQGLDPARYEVYAYSVGFRDRVVSRDPAFDARFDSVIAHRRDLPGDPSGIRARILADDLDVFLYANATTYGIQAMDLALFHRVAPLQAVLNSHLPMAMGYPSFDAVITGESDDPAQEVAQSQHSERLLRVPGPVIAYLNTLKPRARPALDRAALGLSENDVVLMNAGSSMKLRHHSLKAMMQAVAGVPGGVLLLAPYNPGWAARSLAFAFNVQVARTAAEVGLDQSRIRILGELSVAEAEAALSCADVYLNPFPHGGATMTHLALIYGVPPVTLRRASTRSIDQFLVASLGFEELLASSVAEYIALARALGTDPARRRELSARLKTAARTPDFVDSPDHAARMQAALQTLMTWKDQSQIPKQTPLAKNKASD